MGQMMAATGFESPFPNSQLRHAHILNQILKAGSIYGPIHQVSISPNGKLLAIATSHTVHLAILPDSSHLGQFPNRPIKLKTSTIGRTIHVKSQSQIAKILWHPCGLSGKCLVTVTTDAAVRLWEFDEGNRYASDTPSLAIDLKKLALGTSAKDNFTPEKGRNRAYSLDSIGMEVASACFGGSGVSDESPWSAMTLWVAMKGGDLYALCPLLPSKWQAPETILQGLSTTTIAKATAAKEEHSPDVEMSRLREDQYTWIQELDGQESSYTDGPDEFSNQLQVFRRPEQLSPTPKLQGPFRLTSEDNEEYLKGEDEEFSDIHVIASKLDSEVEESEGSDSQSDIEDRELSAAVICLLTRSGKVCVCIDLEGVEGQWLPHAKPARQHSPPAEPYLVFFEKLDTFKDGEVGALEWPTFSRDVNSRYSFFTTHSRSVFFFSFDPWIQSLEKELKSLDSTGSAFRLDVFRHGPGTIRERMLSINCEPEFEHHPSTTVPSCIALEDSDLGYFLLTTHNDHPIAAILDFPLPLAAHDSESDEDESELPDLKALAIGPARSAYQPASAFYTSSEVASVIDQMVPARHKHLLGEQVRLSPATLDLMTGAHRVLSRETHYLGIAAADLFRRCERLIEELKDQIGRVQECAMRSDNLLKTGNAKERWTSTQIRKRVDTAREKQVELQERHESLKKKLHGAGGRKLSEKEKAWAKEVERTDETTKDQSRGLRAVEDRKEDENSVDEGDYEEEEAAEEDKEQSQVQVGSLRKRLEEVCKFSEKHNKMLTDRTGPSPQRDSSRPS